VKYDKIVFMDKEKEEEWKNMEPSLKKFVLDNLKETANNLELRLCIDLLCNVIVDLNNRIFELENKWEQQ